VSLSKRGTIEADANTGATNIEGVFAGGDVVTGPAFVWMQWQRAGGLPAL